MKNIRDKVSLNVKMNMWYKLKDGLFLGAYSLECKEMFYSLELPDIIKIDDNLELEQVMREEYELRR